MRLRRILLLLTAWLAFDLTTPFPGAFEFEIEDSEIEESLLAGRESHAMRTAASARSTPRERIMPDRPARWWAPAVAAMRAEAGDGWVRQVRLAHRPSASRAASTEDH
ncbi:MAG TPA: hypothetical protein VJZ73_02505 [Methylomirabilota bacterium]|nr:hypothetical protein [Methylomirabilota bacterium]